MDNAEYGRSDYSCIYARTIPSIEYVVAYGYRSSPVAYCTPPTAVCCIRYGAQPYLTPSDALADDEGENTTTDRALKL
jgi:hypothetical protein